MATLAPAPDAAGTSILPAVQMNINYMDLKERIKDFLIHYKSSESTSTLDDEGDVYDHQVDDIEIDGIGRGPKYMSLLQKVANRELSTLYISLDDVKVYEETQALGSQTFTQRSSTDLADNVARNTYHFIELFSQVIDEIMPDATINISHKDDVLDVIIHQRKLRNARLENEQRAENENLGADETTPADDSFTKNLFPPQLTRRYCIYFKPLTNATTKGPTKALAVRDVKGEHLGQLITVRGIVTRVSDVKPSIQVNAYTCDTCGYEIFQEVNTRTFQPLTECSSERCLANQHKGKLFPSTRASKFTAFQDVKIQELTNQVPVGHIPRTLTIHVSGDLVRSMNPGDIVDVAGIFLPIPYTGFRALRAGLLTETYLEAQAVKQHKRKYETLGLTPEVEAKIQAIIEETKIREEALYDRLATSIAPEIFGHLDIKKALLLLLVGGVTKEIGDGMRIRGDINVLLMGDPGVAKSQLLKSISKIAPRGVYTTGKGSSGVGLTAAVMRDPITDEMVLEGGALVLADNGVCCIDEFDKMEENDRTAIHEVMEQQTISISKAGINTSLNARASILAAANPLYGRYNTRLSPNENINLPAALLSRFDILFLILDKPSIDNDIKLAEHVAYVHMHNKQPPNDEFEPLDSITIRQFISIARRYRPTISKAISEYVVQKYIKLRKESKANENSNKYFAHTTPRTLLGILRLSQALARIRFSNEVTMNDIDEALRLNSVAKQSLYNSDDEFDKYEETPMSKVYNLIREKFRSSDNHRTVSVSEIRDAAVAKGFTEDLFNECIYKYQVLNVWQLTDENENLVIIGDFGDEDSDEEMED